MTLSDIVQADHIEPNLKSDDRWGAIDELVDKLIASGALGKENREEIIEVIKKREKSMSTGIGFGIGIPHAATESIEEVVGALGRSKAGIDFEALDNQPVNLVVLFLVPQGQFQKHLNTLANIAKLLHNRDFRESIENASDAEAIQQIISQPAE
ncbi:MAG: PTS sugar transporter subunit IIA [Verrucomicrobiota bacterium]|jgi:mannitol/fructose-specific phosphotransferase system IIA component (Ntr-type)|nr:PTS sugar transporter subunit IIA [Verrucomicrobiota bacterium]